MNQFQKLMLQFFNLKNMSSRESREILMKRSEERKSEKSKRCSVCVKRETDIPKIKITDPEEEERERKIREIKEINKKTLRFKITQTASALNGFARQFRIEGVEGFGPREFMQRARTEILRLMRENRQTKVMLILNCEMKKQELI